MWTYFAVRRKGDSFLNCWPQEAKNSHFSTSYYWITRLFHLDQILQVHSKICSHLISFLIVIIPFLWLPFTSLSLLAYLTMFQTLTVSMTFYLHSISDLRMFFVNYINLIDSNYSISSLKDFIHCVATIHKTSFFRLHPSS